MGNRIYPDIPGRVCRRQPLYNGKGPEYSPGLAHPNSGHPGGLHFSYLCHRRRTDQRNHDRFIPGADAAGNRDHYPFSRYRLPGRARIILVPFAANPQTGFS